MLTPQFEQYVTQGYSVLLFCKSIIIRLTYGGKKWYYGGVGVGQATNNANGDIGDTYNGRTYGRTERN
ncbi:MAG: hypothetical protein FWC80_05500 [Firmicutes bacterium]|nr:hypothetical protein [Bacillota bacterium]